MNPPLTETSYNQEDFGELANLKPPGFNINSIHSVADNFAIPPAYLEGGRFNKDLPQREFIYLFDVAKPDPETDLGKCLMLISNLDTYATDRILVRYGYPDRIGTPRNFSIDGVVVADAVEFDGTGDVVLITRSPDPTVTIEFPTISDIQNGAFIEYNGNVPITVNLLESDEVTEFTVYARGEAVEFSGDVVASASGFLIIPHGGIATAKKFSTGHYLIVGDTASP